jgi:predicted nucleotidyltransferase
MRLSPQHQTAIVHCVRQQFGADARVMVFGSRVDDAARGGDVDLLVESPAPPTLRQRALTTLALEQALGLPVDIVARQQGTPGGSFARVVQRHAQAIDGQGMSPSSLPCECAWP